jgi:hypothetical protein
MRTLLTNLFLDQRVRLGLAFAAVVSVGLIALARTGWLSGPPRYNVLLERSIARGVAAYAKVPMQEARAAVESGGLESLLVSAAGSGGTSGLEPDLATALAREATAFVALRFVERDVDRYIAWRKAAGARFAELAHLERHWRVVADFALAMGKPAPAEPTPEDLFRAYFPWALGFGEGANDLSHLPTTDQAVAVRSDVQKGGWIDRFPLAGQMGADLWHGAAALSMRSWFEPRVSPYELMSARGSLRTAEVGFVGGFKDGSRRPVVMCFFLDPDTGRWVLFHVNQHNADPRAISPLEF